MPTASAPSAVTYRPGDAVVVIDGKDLNYLCEGSVVPPPREPMRSDSVYVLCDGDRLWYHSWQLRKGRNGDGTQKVYLGTLELIALVRGTPEILGHLPEPQRSILTSRPLNEDNLYLARTNVAAALRLALEDLDG